MRYETDTKHYGFCRCVLGIELYGVTVNIHD